MIPHHAADITVDWLNEVLPADVGRLAAMRQVNLGAGVGILGEVTRLHLTYRDGEHGPATMVAKCQAHAPENVFLAQAMGFYTREVSFYRECADGVPFRVPRAYVVDADPSGAPFVLLMEDIVGARCPDQIAGLTPDEARRIIDTVAPLHAQYWANDALDALTWLPPMNNPLYKGAQALAEAKWDGFQHRYGSKVDKGLLALVGRAIPRYADYLDWTVSQGNATFTHTDCRAENYLFGGSAGEDVITVLDFQLCTRHFGAWDVANLIGASLLPEVRAAHEVPLVEHYHRRLVEHGVANYTLDDCWHHYRASLVQMVLAGVIVSDLDGANERGAELLEQLFLRPWYTAANHDLAPLIDQL